VPQAVQVTLDVDVALVGAGGAGLSVVVALDRLARERPGVAVPTLALVDPVVRAGTDRTWCFWDGGRSGVEEAVHRHWRRAVVVGPDGARRVLDLDPLRYVMVRSADFYALADAAAHRLGVVRVTADYAEVSAGVRARWVLDSRPAAPARRPNTAWLQHFRGWIVSTDADTFDPDVPVLMDFSTPQPAAGVTFGYVLPLDPRRALVEFTVFSRSRWPSPAYDQALRAYLLRRFGSAGRTARVEHVEDGAIPMTDGVHASRVSRHAFRIGTAGGATRPSTGYTFAAMQRQAEGIAAALLDGRPPVPPRPYPLRHRWMDGVLLRALDRGHVSGAALLTELFARNRPADVLRFLDGGTSLVEDLALMRTTPVLPMARAAAEDAAARARRRCAAMGASVRGW
jgi:lycopene beta-cyclase